MKTISKSFKSVEELQNHLQSRVPTLFYSSQTSTVIPFEKIEDYLQKNFEAPEFCLGNLSSLPKQMELEEDCLVVQGPVTWKEARAFLRSKGRDIMTSPTEELAAIPAGVATSATGERCFGLGTLREQVVSLCYLNYEGDEKTLDRERSFADLLSSPEAKKVWQDYEKDYEVYRSFKNAPYPRFEKATDLMIGTEGQLGVVTRVKIETVPMEPIQYLFLLLPPWEKNEKPHLEILEKIQKFRGKVLSCELVDSNSWAFLKKEDCLGDGHDVIFLEVLEKDFEDFYEKFLATLQKVGEEQIFDISESQFHHVRASVPRAIFEENRQQGVVKKGTDVQVKIEDFSKLLDFYRSFSRVGLGYNLFGHFGDAHLHFNFMPTTPLEVETAQEELEKLYKKVKEWGGSPFAEHGVGFLKQKFITAFYTSHQHHLFSLLKNEFDPHSQFFPMGFMSL